MGLLLVINLFNYLDRQVLAAVVSHIRVDFFGTSAITSDGSLAMRLLEWLRSVFGFELENALIGSLALAFMSAYMILAPVFGWLAERTGRWKLVGFAIILWSLASGGSGLAWTFGMLFLTRCLVGVGEAAYGPVAPAMISDLYPVRMRGRVLAWFYMAIPVGSALGYVFGGTVAGWSGSWRVPFYLVTVPGILLGLWCLWMPEPPRGRADLSADMPVPQARFRDYLVLLRTPSFVLCSLGMTAMTFAIGGIAFWMPDYIHVARGVPDLAQVNLIFGAIVVLAGLTATLLGGLAGDWLRGRFPGSYFLVSGLAMLVGFPLLLAVLYLPFSPIPWAWIFIFLAVFCLFFNTGPTNTILANVTHPSIRASAFAVNIFVIHAFGDAISPLIIGAIADRYKDASGTPGLHEGFLAVSAMVLLAALLWLWGARYLARDTARAPTQLSHEP